MYEAQHPFLMHTQQPEIQIQRLHSKPTPRRIRSGKKLKNKTVLNLTNCNHLMWIFLCISSKGAPSQRKELLHNIDPLEYPHGKALDGSGFDTRVRAAVRVGRWKLITGNPGKQLMMDECLSSNLLISRVDAWAAAWNFLHSQYLTIRWSTRGRLPPHIWGFFAGSSECWDIIKCETKKVAEYVTRNETTEVEDGQTMRIDTWGRWIVTYCDWLDTLGLRGQFDRESILAL